MQMLDPSELMNEEQPNRTANFALQGIRGAGNYILTWPDLNIEARVRYFRTGSDKSVKAEVKFISNRVTTEGHLRSGQIPLTSPTSRSTFAKTLHQSDPSIELNEWSDIMEQLCESVLEDYRTGSPEMLLTGEVEDMEDQEWMIYPIIERDNPTLIFGVGSAGKSIFAQLCAVLVDAGYSFEGLEVRKGNVLYLDWETTHRDLLARVTSIRNVLKLEGKSHIWYKRMSTGLEDGIEEIKQVVSEHEIDFIVIDSMGAALGNDASEQKVVTGAFSAIRSLNVTALVIDHPNKAETGLKALFGSTYKSLLSRHVWEVLKDQQVGDNLTKFALFHRKANNTGLFKEMGWQFTFENNRLSDIERITSKEISKTAMKDGQTQYDQVMNLLATGAKTLPEINSYMDGKNMATRMSEWKGKGYVVSVGDKFALPVKEDEPEKTSDGKWNI